MTTLSDPWNKVLYRVEPWVPIVPWKSHKVFKSQNAGDLNTLEEALIERTDSSHP